MGPTNLRWPLGREHVCVCVFRCLRPEGTVKYRRDAGTAIWPVATTVELADVWNSQPASKPESLICRTFDQQTRLHPTLTHGTEHGHNCPSNCSFGQNHGAQLSRQTYPVVHTADIALVHGRSGSESRSWPCCSHPSYGAGLHSCSAAARIAGKPRPAKQKISHAKETDGLSC